MEGILRTADGQFDVKLNDFLEEVVQIETKHHNNEMSIRLMKYCDLMQYKPVIEKMVDDRGGKLVEEYDKESYPNEELEEAIDLYAKNLDTKESGISRSFVWALCYPSVISAYISYTNAFWANYTFPKDSKNGEYTYTSIAYKHFCDVLQKHVMYLLSGRFDGCKGAFKFIFRYRLKYNVFEEFIKDEFGTEWIFLSRPLREYKRAKEVFYWENGYEPSAEEMSKYMELSLKVAKQRERDLEVRSGLVFLDEYDSKSVK